MISATPNQPGSRTEPTRADDEPPWRYVSGEEVGHCTIIRPLGRGGMGEVYLADLPGTGQVALKAALPKTLESSTSLERFLDEARLTADLDHPNIISALELGGHDGVPHVLMEYVEGRTLRQCLRETTLPLPAMLRIGQGVAEALAEVHRHGILHLDVKPDNVLVTPDGVAHLGDFGIAVRLQRLDWQQAPRVEQGAVSGSTGGKVSGTPRYMAPEQWLRQPISPATDIWALGVLLYEMVTRRPPFRWTTVEGYSEQVTSSDPSPLHHDVIPTVLADLIDRCMNKEPCRRPEASRVAGELQQLHLAGSLSTARGWGSLTDQVTWSGPDTAETCPSPCPGIAGSTTQLQLPAVPDGTTQPVAYVLA